tara:strand:- start:262 stop:588 length:327 start_codon:yes stop_codon:yes gene_type:complete
MWGCLEHTSQLTMRGGQLCGQVFFFKFQQFGGGGMFSLGSGALVLKLFDFFLFLRELEEQGGGGRGGGGRGMEVVCRSGGGGGGGGIVGRQGGGGQWQGVLLTTGGQR